jgi:sorbitol/mannitol transport system permease protein
MTATTTAPLATSPTRTARPPSDRLRAWATRAPLLPALVFMIVVTQLPFVATLVISFFDWNALYPKARHFTGFDNYQQVLSDADLRHSVWTTVLLTVAVVLASLVLGLLLALLLDRKFRGRGFVRTLLIAPFLVVPVAAALLWKHVLYNPEYGLLNGLLHYVGGPQPDWISNNPLLAVEASLVWQWTPFMMLILLAGLQSRDQQQIEAAKVDGANDWQVFRYLTSAVCWARSTSCRTSTRSSRSRRAAWAPPTCPTPSTRASTRPTRTASPRRPASWSSSARSSSRPSPCASCRPCSVRRRPAHEQHRRTRA